MHIIEKCKHGKVVRQCRCPGGTLTIVPCTKECTSDTEPVQEPLTLLYTLKNIFFVGSDAYPEEVPDDVDIMVVHEVVGTTRWGVIHALVYHRAGEYVRMLWEYSQSKGYSDNEPTFTIVKPVEKTVIEYVKA